ncbi:MAG: zinc-binding dehydrogenase [Corynebacterium sp.]|nr:zinc-binding dehydrogenase [Corynebacterium sp.]
MKAFVLEQSQTIDDLHEAEVFMATHPTAGKVRIRVHAVGLNPVDYKIASHHPAQWEYPHISGLDIAGTVIAGGSWPVGTRVLVHHDLRAQGGLAEYVDVDARAVAVIPATVSFEAAAALPTAALTAYQAVMDRLRVAPGQVIGIIGGSGAVGAFAIQLAKQTGAMVVATSSTAKAQWVRDLGADVVIDYTQGDLWEQLGAYSFDGIIDTVGTSSATHALEHIKHGGGLVTINGAPQRFPEPFAKAISLHEVALGAAYSHGESSHIRQLSQDLSVVLNMVAVGDLDPLCQQLVGWDGVVAAFRDLQAGKIRGKVVARLRD